MTRRVVRVGAWDVTIASDDPPPPDLFHWAVLRTRVFDELTLASPLTTMRIVGDVARCVPRVAGDGTCGFVGRPRDVAHALLQADTWHARIEAAGYLAHDLTTAIERARRALNPGVVPPATSISLDAPVSSDAEQFVPGRGVIVERDAASVEDEFSMTGAASPPPPLGTVPLAPPLQRPHAALRRVAGVPLLLPDQALHRASAARIRGRILRRIPGPGGTLVPATGASIGIRGVWQTYPATTSSPPVAVEFCAMSPPLRFDHDVGAGVEHASVSPLGAPITLLEPVAQAAREVTVAPNGGLAPGGGDVLRLEDPTSAEHEILVSDGFDPVTDPEASVRVRLRTPAASMHRRGASVQRVTASGLGSIGTLVREAQVGDAVVFASNLAALPATTGAVVVARGTPRESWHVATQLPTTPNDATFLHSVVIGPDGRFDWPPIARIAQVRVRALHPGYVPLEVDYALDYNGDNALSMNFVN
jgi:hypothetical protein